MHQRTLSMLCAALFLAISIACSAESSAPLAPTPPPASPSDGSSLKVTAPTPQGPSNGETLTGLNVSQIMMSAGAATPTHISSASLQYEFQLLNSDGSVIESSGLLSSPSWTQTSTLAYTTRYSWRARAVRDDAVGPWSDTFSFVTGNLPPHFRCGPPFHFAPLEIIRCQRALFGGLNSENLPIMLRRIARDFNKAGVEGGPFGLLVKTIGNNCGGYSCDILCAQHGGDHDQWDLLLDENIPQFIELHDPRVRPCRIQGSEQSVNE